MCTGVLPGVGADTRRVGAGWDPTPAHPPQQGSLGISAATRVAARGPAHANCQIGVVVFVTES
jgi:hypothetical protein